jgi:predicted nuclease of predicted toxin-antitoxin system
MSPESSDQEVFAYARHAGAIMVTCNRNDFLALAIELEHSGAVMAKA